MKYVIVGEKTTLDGVTRPDIVIPFIFETFDGAHESAISFTSSDPEGRQYYPVPWIRPEDLSRIVEDEANMEVIGSILSKEHDRRCKNRECRCGAKELNEMDETSIRDWHDDCEDR